MIVDLCIMAFVAICVVSTYIMVKVAETHATDYPDDFGEEKLPRK